MASQIANLQHYTADSNQVLHEVKDQVLSVVCP